MNTELILSIVVASATTIYTVITIFQLRESRKVRFQKEAPNIVPYLKSTEDHTTIQLYIENFGEGVAKDVQVEFIKDFNRFNKEDLPLSQVGISKNGLNYFPPKYLLKYGLGIMVELNKENHDEKIILEISYKSLNNHKFKNVFELPINQIFGQSYSTPPETYMGQIPYYLKEINNQLKNFNK